MTEVESANKRTASEGSETVRFSIARQGAYFFVELVVAGAFWTGGAPGASSGRFFISFSFHFSAICC